jgi:hypothetical protein
MPCPFASSYVPTAALCMHPIRLCELSHAMDSVLQSTFPSTKSLACQDTGHVTSHERVVIVQRYFLTCCDALQITLKRRQAALVPVAINMAAGRLLGSLPVIVVLAILALTIPAGEVSSFRVWHHQASQARDAMLEISLGGTLHSNALLVATAVPFKPAHSGFFCKSPNAMCCSAGLAAGEAHPTSSEPSHALWTHDPQYAQPGYASPHQLYGLGPSPALQGTGCPAPAPGMPLTFHTCPYAVLKQHISASWDARFHIEDVSDHQLIMVLTNHC